MKFGFPDLAAAELTLIIKQKQNNKKKSTKHPENLLSSLITLSQGRRKFWRLLISEGDIQIILPDEYLSHQDSSLFSAWRYKKIMP